MGEYATKCALSEPPLGTRKQSARPFTVDLQREWLFERKLYHKCTTTPERARFVIVSWRSACGPGTTPRAPRLLETDWSLTTVCTWRTRVLRAIPILRAATVLGTIVLSVSEIN